MKDKKSPAEVKSNWKYSDYTIMTILRNKLVYSRELQPKKNLHDIPVIGKKIL